MERVTDLIQTVHDLSETLKHSENVAEAEAIRDRLLGFWPNVEAEYQAAENLADLWRGLHANMNFLINMQLNGLMSTVQRRQEVREEAEQFLAAQSAPLQAPTFPTAPPVSPADIPRLQTPIQILMGAVTNSHQAAALQKLDRRREEDLVYLSQYVKNTDTSARARDVEGVFTVLGSMRKGVRDAYTIKWYKPGTASTNRGSFWCSCPDHKFNSSKKNMVCKHICFLVCRVGKIFDPAFFNGTKCFTEAQHAAFQEIVSNAAALAQMPAPTRVGPTRQELAAATAIQLEERRRLFRELRKPVDPEDSCPICYDTMEATACLNCPTCSNNVHEECMVVWLENHDTCVFCRSTAWRSFVRT